jgi:hypothetical protein
MPKALSPRLMSDCIGHLRAVAGFGYGGQYNTPIIVINGKDGGRFKTPVFRDRENELLRLLYPER